MIARRRHGRAPAAKSAAYPELMRRKAMTDYKRTPGNLGAWRLHRVEAGIAHFEMLTFWEDIAAIKRFAGEDYEKAVYYDFDDEYLLEKEPNALHFDLHAG